MDGADVETWMETVERATDVAAPGPLTRLAAMLDHEQPPWPAGEVPPLGHWLYFLPQARQSRLERDGHPRRGGVVPSAAFPRRMWAGSRLEFSNPIRVGTSVERRSVVKAVTPKRGKSGDMLFVTLRHEILDGQTVAVTEEQDIVYRGAAGAAAPQSAAEAPQTEIARSVTPDSVLLFRFSALTFNGHRIHYDRDYARDVEGYPGLVVHGPLIATLLMDHLLRHVAGARVKTFSFRAQRPLFDLEPFSLFLAPKAEGVALWAAVPGQPAAMTAEAEFN